LPRFEIAAHGRFRRRLVSLALAVAAGVVLAACSSAGSGFVSSANDGATASALPPSYQSEPGRRDPNGPRTVIEKPTLADIAVPGPIGDRSIGAADAPVTVVEYASLTCPYCRKFHAEEFPAIKKK